MKPFLFLLVAATVTHGLPVTTDRITYTDSKQHLREDWAQPRTSSMSAFEVVGEHTLLFCIKQNNIDQLKNLLSQISDPNHPTFRQHLTFDEIGQLSSNSIGTDAVVAWLEASGAQVLSVTPRGEYIEVKAPIALWTTLLQANFFQLRHTKTDNVITRCNAYSLPAAVAQYVNSVAYTSQLPPRISAAPMRQMAAGASTTTIKTLQSAYKIDNDTSSLTHGSQSVFESLGQYYSPSDLTAFAKSNNYIPVNITDEGGHQSSSECLSDPNSCGEANLDVQYITAVAPGIPTTFWYVAESNSLYYDYLVAVANQVNPVLVHSISYGSLERELEVSILDNFDTELIKLGLMGITVVVATGDDGVANFQARSSKSSCGYNPSYPASSPYVTAVGATQGIETGTEEIACTSTTGGLITTGGGFSTHYEQPSWQAAAVDQYFSVAKQPASSSAGYDKTKRGYPDVGLAGHNYEIIIGGQSNVESGTSASAPVFAAMVSLVNSARLAKGKSSVGFLNPALYAMNSTGVFTDVTSGQNNCAAGENGKQVCCEEGFHAARGWDPLTGWGSIDFQKFKAHLARNLW